MSKFDMIGKIFNDWKVVEFSGKDRFNKSRWRCVCLGCGREKTVDGHNLRSGRSKSCRRCSALVVVAAVHASHRETGTPMYRRWTAMRHRCSSPKNAGWNDYGGRGIRVHPAWAANYETFRDDILASIGRPPTLKHTIDRIDNDGHYEPGNVRWATPSEQMNNTRRSKKLRKIQL